MRTVKHHVPPVEVLSGVEDVVLSGAEDVVPRDDGIRVCGR